MSGQQDEKLQLKVYTTAPALQFYSGNYLGRHTVAGNAQPYADWQGLALESEFLPDSARTTLNGRNRTASCVLAKSMSSLTEYQFIAEVMLSPRDWRAFFILILLTNTPLANTDIFATQYSQATLHCDDYFRYGYAISIAVASSRQYNENYYH